MKNKFVWFGLNGLFFVVMCLISKYVIGDVTLVPLAFCFWWCIRYEWEHR